MISVFFVQTSCVAAICTEYGGQDWTEHQRTPTTTYTNHGKLVFVAICAGLPSIPPDIPSNVVGVTLQANPIIEIPGNILQHIPQVQSVTMSYNKIESVHPKAFAGLNTLQDLHLEVNKISQLPESVFHGLNSLIGIYLQNNLLLEIYPSTFSNLNQLSHLDLRNNRLTTLNENSLLPSSHAVALYLYLEGNPILCNINVCWLKDWETRNWLVPSTNIAARFQCVIGQDTWTGKKFLN